MCTHRYSSEQVAVAGTYTHKVFSFQVRTRTEVQFKLRRTYRFNSISDTGIYVYLSVCDLFHLYQIFVACLLHLYVFAMCVFM